MTTAFVNQIATRVPEYDMHAEFIEYAEKVFDPPSARIFRRMTKRAGISHRWMPMPHLDDFYHGAPNSVDMNTRMREFEIHASRLAIETVHKLGLGDRAREVTHLIVVTNTGYHTPGVDFALIEACGLDRSVERTQVAFMGCHAGVCGLKLAHHIVRSQPRATVLVVVLEICSLHLRHTKSLPQMLSMLIFGDGCGAALVTSREAGLALDSFRAFVIPGTRDLMTLRAGPHSIEVNLSGQVPIALGRALSDSETISQMLNGHDQSTITTWAVHPGGRSILDAVGTALGLSPADLEISRHVLDNFGNMASAAILFVFAEIMSRGGADFRGERGCALAFGPGLTAETLLFRI